MLFGRRFNVLFGRLTTTRTEGAEESQQQRAQRLARAALRLYGLSDIEEIELLRHSFVVVFRVRSASRGEFALRLYGLPERVQRPGSKPPDADSRTLTAAALRSPQVLHSQLTWLSALRDDTGLLVPAPVPTLEGELVGQVRVEGTPWQRRAALVRWVPGTHKGEDLTEADLFRVGSFVATMHNHAEGYAIPEGSEFPRWDWQWAFGKTAHVWSKGPEFYSEKEMKVFRRAARHTYRRLEELGESRDVFGLIHRDTLLQNIVFSNEGVGVIDFDMCGIGYYLFDLAILRMSLNGSLIDVPEGHRTPLWKSLLRGYEDVRPLPEPIRAHLERYLDTFNALHRVGMANNWLQKLNSATLKPERQEQFTNYLKRTPRRLRRLLQH